MAELASGAVSSLLVVIRNEALLLRGVRDDVQFIKEEMESMNSFLTHLARSAPPGGEHDDQVRTWMTQVRLLAQDCNNCIDLYLYRGNPDIHRARGGLRRYVWWISWFLHKMAAQHRAAIQLRQLKDRARDVGERRLRYGVEVPGKSTTLGQSPHVAAGGYAAADDEEDRDEEDQTAKIQLVTLTTHHYGRRAFFEPRARDDYVKAKLLEWISALTPGAGETLSIAIVAPDTDQDVLALALKTLVVPLFPPAYTNPGYHRGILVNIPAVHLNTFFFPVPLRPKEVLFYILRELKHAESGSQKQDTDQSKGHKEEEEEEEEEEEYDFWQDCYRKRDIYLEKKEVIHKIKEKIRIMKIYEKVDKIKREVLDPQQKDNQQQLFQQDLGQKKGADEPDLVILLQKLLHPQQDRVKNRDMQPVPVWDDNTITEIAKKFKEYMEADEKANELKEEMGAEEKEDTAKQEKGEYDGGVQRKEENVEEKRDKTEEKQRGERNKEEEEKEGERQSEEEQVGGGGREEQENEEGDKREEEKGEEGVGTKGEKGGGDEEEKGDVGVEMEEEKGVKEEEKGEIEEMEEKEKEEEENEGNNDNKKDCEEDQEEDEEEGPIYLHQLQYEKILREVFPMQAQQQDRSAAKQASKITTTTLDEERIKQMIHEAKQEVLRELQECKPDKNQATGEPHQNKNSGFEEITQKFEKIKRELKEQLKIKGIVDKIKKLLGSDCPLIILKVDEMMDGSRWEDFRKALSLLECSADALIFTTSENIQEAKGYCYPPREPIDYSLVGLYNDTVLELTSKQQNEDNFDPQVFRDILECCFYSKINLEEYEPHEFCMKIFTHALYANSNRSSEELIKLRSTLQALPKSFDILAKKMFMYSYNDLPKEYKSCLLYLAIFPKGQKIRQSDLIGRWVAEGLIVKEDWPSSVKQARRCFDALIRRWLVYPADIGATGKVKSCVVGDLVHGFITTIARKQHFVETRLSHHLARHFSVFNDLQLRSSDKIDKFFQDLSKSSRVSLLKVLDLEGCCFGGKNQRYLRDICTKMLLLKYLSLRGTDITQLPSEINYLRELEVLDIRQTKVHAQATANILLLKLKRLLAGDIGPNSSNFGSVQIPHRIGKMVKVEVLSNVKAQNSSDLKDIGKLWQLRKLGVVIDGKDSQLGHLLQTISDLHECLRSLSITLPTVTPREGTPSSVKVPGDICSRLRHNPKILESLSISGTTLKGHLLPVITKGGNNKLAKVNLSSTLLNQDDLDVLAKLPKLQCVRLHHIDCPEGMLTFEKGRFISLKCLFLEGSDLTNITFEDEAACELEKMVLSFTSAGSISGVDRLPKLEELELNNSSSGRLLSSFQNAKQIAKLTLRGTLLTQDALQILTKIPNIRCLVLLDKSFDGIQNQITFNKDEFIWLNLLLVHCSSITEIVFTSGSAPRLEKIVWSSLTSLSGIQKLPRLKELEFNGKDVPKEMVEAIAKHKNKPSLKQNGPETQDHAKGDEEEDDNDAAKFLFCWKKQV